MSMPRNATARKPMRSEGITPKRFAVHCRSTRRQIIEDAIDLLTNGDPREISKVLASRHRLSEHQVDRYLTAAVVSLKRAFDNLKVGTANALIMAQEALEETEEEVLA